MAQRHLQRPRVSLVPQELDGEGMAKPMTIGLDHAGAVPDPLNHVTEIVAAGEAHNRQLDTGEACRRTAAMSASTRPQSTCSNTTWRFCVRSTCESPLKTESYSSTSVNLFQQVSAR
jgi:hypothetical protein